MEPKIMGPRSSSHGAAFGRYRLLEKIGEGGMAEVFKAKSFGVEGFEKVLVIKRIREGLAASPKFIEMFVREAKLAVRLSHANIVQVFDLGRVDPTGKPSTYFIAMEYVPGIDLARVLAAAKKDGKQLPIALAIYVVGEVAKALDHAHRRRGESGQPLGIVHRDISPQNILVSFGGDVKVADFGIAKANYQISDQEAISSELRAPRAAGKASFMSPEQVRGEDVDARSDLFSLGAVFYELLTGANPFRAHAQPETFRRIAAGEYPPLALARPDVTAELAAIVNGLLESSAEARTESAAALSEQLLTYAYAAGHRFGAPDLAEVFRSMRLDRSSTAPAMDDMAISEPAKTEEQTPVEIPQPSSPSSDAPTSQDGHGEGERREVTIMVVSVNPPTGMDTTAAWASCHELLEQRGAWLERREATQAVAVFGIGETDGRDAEAAVRAGLSLVRERNVLRPSVGIHSGSIGVDDGGLPLQDGRLEQLTSVAANLARLSEEQVGLSRIAARLVRRSFVSEQFPDDTRALADGGVLVRRAVNFDASQTRFVGRTRELKRVGRTLAEATRRGLKIVTVEGQTGVGKTRLIHEARRRLARGSYEVGFYVASCPLHGATQKNSGLRAMMHVLCGTAPQDPPERQREGADRLRALGLDLDQLEAMMALVGAVEPSQRQSGSGSLRVAFERVIRGLARDHLQVFCWDDAQALDQQTLMLLLRIQTSLSRLPVVFLLVYRGELPPALRRDEKVERLRLAELATDETEHLIADLLGARSVPNDLLKYVRTCAGGHPLFVDELLRKLCDDGLVQVLNGVVTMSEEPQTTAPRPLRTLIADRVSRLPQRQRSLLQTIAVLGEPAMSGHVATFMRIPLPNLDRLVTDLEKSRLLGRDGPTKLMFASPLYREIILDSLPGAVRDDLHTRAAATYEEMGTAERPYHEKIADHLVGSGDRPGAVARLWRAADVQIKAARLERALDTMLLAVELADPTGRPVSELLDWLAAIAEAISQVRHAADLPGCIEPLLEQVEQRGTRSEIARARTNAARAFGAVNLFEQAYAALDFDGDELGDSSAIEIHRLTTLAELAARHGAFERAVEACKKLDELGAPEERGLLLTMSLVHAATGEHERSLEKLKRCEEEFPPDGALASLNIEKHRMLAWYHHGDFALAGRTAARLVRLARESGLRYETAVALHNLGDTCARLGHHPQAYAAFVESVEISEALGQGRLENMNRMHLCLLDGMRSADGAEERLKSCIRIADGNGFLWDVIEGRQLLAKLLATQGRHEQARALLPRVIEDGERHGHLRIVADARTLLDRLTGDEESSD